MKNTLLVLTVLLAACTSRKPIEVDAETVEGQVLLTMEKWGRALKSGDIDETMQYYSENYSGTEAKDKKGVRELLNEAKSYGMLWLVDINLETAKLEVRKDTAEIVIFNDDGEVEMDFSLALEDKGWKIIGIPSEICKYEDYAKPYGDQCVFIEDHYRCWDIHIPEGLSGLVPLLIDFHGWTEDAAHQRSISGFEELSETEGFIVVWPHGLCNSWNAGAQCCSPASDNAIDDIGFVRKMIAEILEKHGVDRNRIYLTGLSNGCAMAQRVSNEASEIITATACMSLHLLTETDTNYSALPVMTLMGTKDDLYTATEDMPGAKENLERWKQMNNCQDPIRIIEDTETYITRSYTQCENNTEVMLVTIEDGGHMLYQGEDTEVNTTQLAWEFMKKFTK